MEEVHPALDPLTLGNWGIKVVHEDESKAAFRTPPIANDFYQHPNLLLLVALLSSINVSSSHLNQGLLSVLSAGESGHPKHLVLPQTFTFRSSRCEFGFRVWAGPLLVWGDDAHNGLCLHHSVFSWRGLLGVLHRHHSLMLKLPPNMQKLTV